MSGISSSFASVSEQIINYNNNILELLSKLNDIAISNSSSVNFQIADQFGVLKTYSIPSFGYILSEIQRLNNNLNSLYSIDDVGALIQTSSNKFRRVITVDLNKEPKTLSELSQISSFKSNKNWFFDGLLNPELSVELDLSDKIEYNVRKILSRRYIVNFSKNSDGTLTNVGQSALNSFNNTFRNKTSIKIEDFIFWSTSTPGVDNPNDPNYDEQVFDLDPNELLYSGTFSIIKTEEDRINNKLWYHLNTLNYLVNKTSETKQLSIDDEVIINTDISNTRYKVIEISTLSSNFRVRFELIEGIQPLPVGNSTIKIYSPILFNKKVRISIGYNERNVIFIKPLNTDNYLLARDWSLGVGFWSNDLNLNSEDTDNGTNMEKYYTEKVYDYGEILDDLVTKKIPSSFGAIPNKPVLVDNNFKVVQVNQHLTNSPDSNLIKSKHNQLNDIKSELTQLSESINSMQKQAKVFKATSVAAKSQFDNELTELIKKKDSKNKLQTSLVGEIMTIGKNVTNTASAKYRVRGFWEMPASVVSRGSRPQEVVQFLINYRYLSKDGKEPPVETFKIVSTDKTKLVGNGAFSNWTPLFTDARKRSKDANGNPIWEIQNLSDADTPNINQLDISIQQGEVVEIRIKSISEVGFPDSPIYSDWSDILTVKFPDDLNSVIGDNDFILKQASQDEVKIQMETQLSARGLNDVLNNVVVLNNKTYTSSSENILSGFNDNNGIAIDLMAYLKQLQDKITSLEETIKRAKGELKITIFRNNDEYVVKNGSTLEFNVECEDYLSSYTGTGIPTGRVYSNDIYVVRDFIMKIENVAQDSPLGLLSNRSYYVNSDLFNNVAPQIFWVNERDEFQYSQLTGSTRTQLDNQFLWSCNYEVTNQTTISKLADDIGNAFSGLLNNSLVSSLSSTEFNIGYSDSTLLAFLGSNNSLLEMQKWTDTSISVASNTKLLTTIHPIVQDLTKLVENNSQRVKTVLPGKNNLLVVPLNIYFKMNSIDPNTGTGNNYQYVNLNNNQTTVKHIKKLKFLLENESENRPFIFTIKFNINRSKVVLQKITNSVKTTISSQL